MRWPTGCGRAISVRYVPSRATRDGSMSLGMTVDTGGDRQRDPGAANNLAPSTTQPTRKDPAMPQTMTDLSLTCVDCREAFAFSASEQRFYAERAMKQPTRCPRCRAERRAERNADLIVAYETSTNGSSWDAGHNPYAGMTAGRGTKVTRVTFRATCAACGKETEVPFQPRNGRPVYCRECYSSRKGK